MSRLVPFFSLVLVLAGCGEREAPHQPGTAVSPESVITEWPATQLTDGGSFSVTLQPVDGSIARNRHFSLQVSVTSESSTSDKLKVSVDADMPAHRHGMNTKPEISEIEAHQFRADGMLFHMSGHWVITVEVTGKTGPEQATFPVSIE
jgi:hypothetical protein